MIWGRSTGILDDIRVYRQERMDCSTRGMPDWVASDVILAAAPGFSRQRARAMVDAMLALTIARRATWLWTGLQEQSIINRH